MARIRTVKPDFFRHVGLFEAEKESGLPLRVAFAGIWTAADREGRFKWLPRQIKLDCLPYDDLDFEQVLSALAERYFVVKYEHEGEFYGFVPSWKQHQVINQREAQSKIPAPSTDMHVHTYAFTCNSVHIPSGVNLPSPLRETVMARDGSKCLRCGATEDLTIDHIFPRSMGGTHAITNLRTLCRSCNSARPVAGDAFIADLQLDGLFLSDMERICMHVHAYGEGKGREGKGKGIEVPREDARSADFAFAGMVIRLTTKDFEKWKIAFPNLDLLAELTARDAWLASDEATPQDRKKWFVSTSQHFANRNMKAKAGAYKPPKTHEEMVEEAAYRGLINWSPPQ